MIKQISIWFLTLLTPFLLFSKTATAQTEGALPETTVPPPQKETAPAKEASSGEKGLSQRDLDELMAQESLRIFLDSYLEDTDPIEKESAPMKDEKAFCGITLDDAKEMKTFSDKQIERFIKKIIAERKTRGAEQKAAGQLDKFSDSRWKLCSKNCTCAIFQDLLEKTPPDLLTPYDLKMRETIDREVEEQNSEKILSCLRNRSRFCNQYIFKGAFKALEEKRDLQKKKANKK